MDENTRLDPCRPGRRCGRWRTCHTCGTIRQAKIADRAEALLNGWPDVRLYTLRQPTDAAPDLDNLRRRFLDSLRSPAGIWTIEASEDGLRLHLHALAAGIPRRQIEAAHIWMSEPVRSIRNAAAYISKPGAAPPATTHHGRIYGTFGHAQAWLLSDRTPPLVRAAAIESLLATSPALADLPLDLGQPADYAARPTPIYSFCKQETEPDYKAIAARHLPRLRALVASWDNRAKK